MTTVNNLLVTIDTTVPTLSIGQIQITADRRSTEKEKLTDSERIRRCVLPANHWGDLDVPTLKGARSQQLADVLRIALVEIASKRLKDTLTASPMERTVVLADYTIPALLVWNAEGASSRGCLTFTREQVEAWLIKSHTLAALQVKWKLANKDGITIAAMTTLVTQRFATLAARNHGMKEEAEALKLASLIDVKDLEGSDSELVTELLGRIDHIAKALASKTVTVSIADL